MRQGSDGRRHRCLVEVEAGRGADNSAEVVHWASVAKEAKAVAAERAVMAAAAVAKADCSGALIYRRQ